LTLNLWEGFVKKYLLIILLLFSANAASTQAQTTVATFDNPLCAGNGVGVYQGIDFSLSPWDCEKTSLTGQTGTSISWYQQITTAHFGFPLPRLLVSLSAATSSGSGVLTITTDAGESFSHAINTAFQTLQTGFSKAASVVTVQYPGGWTIQLDNITYQALSSPPVPGTLGASATLSWDDGTPVAGSVTLLQILGPTSQRTLGMFPVNSTGALSGTIMIDLTQPDPLTFQILLLGPTNANVGSTTFQVIKAMFPATATGINAKLVLWKATSTIKTFDIGLTP
jgi:hypothetical protein